MNSFTDFTRAAAGLAMGRLSWPPRRFWDATPADLALALGAWRPAAADALSRDEFDALQARFPDHD